MEELQSRFDLEWSHSDWLKGKGGAISSPEHLKSCRDGKDTYRCFCGNVFKAKVSSVLSGDTKSCGCLAGRPRKHGLCRSPLYSVWSGIKRRCSAVKGVERDLYSGRGIELCEEWKNFLVFYEWAISSGYSQGLSIDRKDNDLGYFAANCRWVTKEVQARNKRTLIKSNTSGFRGVSEMAASSPAAKRFRASISAGNGKVHLGVFSTAEEAAKAYDSYVIFHGLEHPLNFK